MNSSHRIYFPCGKKSKKFNSLTVAVQYALETIRFGVIEIRPNNVKNSVTPFGWKHKGSIYASMTKEGVLKIN